MRSTRPGLVDPEKLLDELWAHQPGDESLYRLGIEIDGPHYGMTTN